MEAASPRVSITLGANASKLESELQKARNTTRAAFEAMGGSAKRFEDHLAKLNAGKFNTMARDVSSLNSALAITMRFAGGFAAAFSVDRVVRGFAAANAELAKIGDTAKRLNTSTTGLQEIRFAASTKGISGSQASTDLEKMGGLLNDGRRGEDNSLTKLFEANSVSLRNNRGEIIGINEALARTADLVKNAATEFDKIKIAELAGLTREWVPVLEQGGEAFRKIAAGAQEAGAIIDAETIAKAKQFETEWSAAVERWGILFRSNLGGIIGLIDALTGKAAGLFGKVADYSRSVQGNEDLKANGVEGASRETMAQALVVLRRNNQPVPDNVARRIAALDEMDRESRRGAGFGRIGTVPLEVDVKPRGGRHTVIPGDGRSGGRSDEDTRADQVDRYIASLERVQRVLEAERDTIGQSVAERAKAIELARIGTVTDEAQKAKLLEIVGVNETIRQQITARKEAERGVADAISFSGRALTDGIEDAILNSERLENVAQNLARSFAKAALQAALIGEGPLAGIFGTKGANGTSGGLFGMLGSAISGALGVPAVRAHSGGTVGISTESIALAPRFHTGGVVGSLGPKEHIAVLEQGERVLTQAQATRNDIAIAGMGAMIAAPQSGGTVVFGDTVVNISGNADARVLAVLRAELAARDRALFGQVRSAFTAMTVRGM